MLPYHTESSIKYGKPGLYWVNYSTTICKEHFFQECSLFFFENQEGVSLSQAARIPRTFTITFYGGNKGENYYLFNSPSTPSSDPIRYTTIKMDSDNYQGTVSWNEDDGLELNFNAGAPSNKDYVFPGDSYSIIATTEFNSWNNCRTGTYTVEAGNPTVGLP